jgi:hypothetical protein
MFTGAEDAARFAAIAIGERGVACAGGMTAVGASLSFEGPP